MRLTLGATLLDSKIEIKSVLYPQCTVGASVWNAQASLYLCIALVLLKSLYMRLIYPSVDSEATASLICSFQQT